MRAILLLFISFLFFQTSIFAQNERLPIGFAPQEQQAMTAYLKEARNRSSFGINEPPSEPIRTIAEWEELQGIVVTWNSLDYDLLTEIVRYAKEECEVYIVTTNESFATNYLTDRGVDVSTNITFIDDNHNTIWMRDYGANPAYINDVDSLVLIDWIYNRPRPLDDDIPESVAQELGVPLYRTLTQPFDLVHTGGNFMTDGLGLAFSSKLVLEENGNVNTWGDSNHSEETIKDLMEDFMGIDEYALMEVLPYDGIHHIDMHMKLLDEQTLLVGEYPQNIADGPQIEANIQYVLSNFETSFGTPFKIVRIPMPPDEFGRYPHQNGDYRTYANALFVNKTVLVPVYEEQYDSTALRIWEETLPGYNIVGLDCNDIINYGGAIHCITKEIGVDDPLWIAHQALPDVIESMPQGYEAIAKIKHRSGISSATLWYTTDLDLGMQSIDMNLINASEDLWSATIPEQSTALVKYYIEATANSGRQVFRPLPAPAAYFEFEVSLVSTQEISASNTAIAPIYPNPSNAITCIPVETAQALNDARISLKNSLGQTVSDIHRGAIPRGASNYFFNAQDFAPGVYIVELQTNKGLTSQKVIIH